MINTMARTEPCAKLFLSIDEFGCIFDYFVCGSLICRCERDKMFCALMRFTKLIDEISFVF